MKRFFSVVGLIWLCEALSIFATVTPTIYQATGLTPSDIQPVVDEFRRDISRGGTDNGNLPGPLPNGRREIDWEQPLLLGALIFPQKGAYFTSGPLFTLQVSRDTPPLNFSDIDPSYLNTFQPFGSPRMMANVLEERLQYILTGFFIPVLQLPPSGAYVNSVGIVFSDVDLQGSTVACLFLTDYTQLCFEVPARPGDGSLSFLGISFGDDSPIQGVDIYAGNAALAPGRLDGAGTDLVTIDRVIFGEPSSVPEPSTVAFAILGLLMLIARIQMRCRP